MPPRTSTSSGFQNFEYQIKPIFKIEFGSQKNNKLQMNYCCEFYLYVRLKKIIKFWLKIKTIATRPDYR